MTFQNHSLTQNLSSLSEIDRALTIRGRYHQITQNNLRNLKGSALWILGPVLAGTFITYLAGQHAKRFVYGCDGKGGEFLSLRTKYSVEEIQYNREFQKFRFT